MSFWRQSYPPSFLPAYLTSLLFICIIVIWCIVNLSIVRVCPYGTPCSFNTINNVCTLLADNRTMIINKTNASPNLLYYCNNNSTITCYYAKVGDSGGDYLGDYYKDQCTSTDVLQASVTLLLAGLSLIIILGYHLLACYQLKKEKKFEQETQQRQLESNTLANSRIVA